ncbi:cupin domain-containing protein [Sphingobacterium kitahiroshimense]|uniref:cupin domain-containing protein n=1 Tax=Sphingobacterium kitahiroshimense TaxID=470446 RepID=UPI003207A167
MLKKESTTCMNETDQSEQKQFSSKDFHQTFARPNYVKASHIIHKNVESTGVHNQFSTERKQPVFFIDLPSKNISMNIAGLLPGQKTHLHRHTYETLLYIMEGKGWTKVEDEIVEWEAGDAVYIPSWAWHQHQNLSETEPAKYIACENAPQLQNLGVALREEQGRDF